MPSRWSKRALASAPWGVAVFSVAGFLLLSSGPGQGVSTLTASGTVNRGGDGLGQAWAAESPPSEGPAAASPPAASEPAEAGEHAEHAPSLDFGKLGLQLLNFAVLLFVLIKFGGGAINKMLAARHGQLKADLAAAAALRAAAEAKLVKQEERLARLEGELTAMRDGIRAEAESEKERLLAAAQERTRRIQAETTFLVEQQVREAEARLRRESATAALAIAEEILRRAVGPADQQTFLDKFISGIGDAHPPRGVTSGNPPGKAGLDSGAATASKLAEGAA